MKMPKFKTWKEYKAYVKATYWVVIKDAATCIIAGLGSLEEWEDLRVLQILIQEEILRQKRIMKQELEAEKRRKEEEVKKAENEKAETSESPVSPVAAEPGAAEHTEEPAGVPGV